MPRRQLSDEDLRHTALRRLRARRDAPLRYAELWHRDKPRTSQQAIGRLVSSPLVDAALVSGGNGSGKTELAAQIYVAVMCGRNNPDARMWAIRNNFPLSRLPDRPGRVIASALTSNDSRRVLREKVKAYLPKGSVWRKEDADGEAEVREPGGGVIIFKSNDQGRRAYQGDWADLVGLDEEHDHDVYNECLMRVSRVPGGMGWVLLTMTPLKGRTWVYDEFVKEHKASRPAMWIFGEDNPYLPQDKMARILAGYGEHERAARSHGEFVVLEGRVYQFLRHLHVVPSFVPPPEWPRFRSWDFGTRNPTSVGWYALDTLDDVLHKYGEHYQPDWTLSQHAAQVKAMTGEDRIVWTVADSADLGARLALARDHGIETIPSVKDVRAGINAVAERLRPDANGRPHLVIHDNCPNTIREFDNYVWAKRGGNKDQPDMPLKANDHAMDELQYMCTQLARSQYGKPMGAMDLDLSGLTQPSHWSA